MSDLLKEETQPQNKEKPQIKEFGWKYYFLYFFQPILFVIILSSVPLLIKESLLTNIYFLMITTHLSFILPIILFLLIKKERLEKVNYWKEIKENFAWKNVFIGVGFGLLIWISYTFILGFLIKPTESSETVELLTENLSFPALVVLTGIVTPIIEEFFFRFFPKKINQKMKSWFYILTSSVAFAMYHLQVGKCIRTTVYTLLVSLLSGIAFSLMYIWKKDISMSIFSHTTFNLISIGIIAILS